MESSAKRYRCRECGHETVQTTNHYGSTWSFGHYNTCPQCPPYKKYPEYGVATYWDCVDVPTEAAGDEAKASHAAG